MDNKKIHTDFLHGEELPAGILPPDAAWKDMQQRLDKDQPDKSGVLYNDPGKDKAFRSRIVRGSALLLLLLLTWLIIQQTNKTNGNTSGSVAGKTVSASKEPGNQISQDTKTPLDPKAPDASNKSLPPSTGNLTSAKKKELHSTPNDPGIGEVSMVIPNGKTRKRNNKVSTGKNSTTDRGTSKQNNITSKNKNQKEKIRADQQSSVQNDVSTKNVLPGDTKTVAAINDSINNILVSKNNSPADKKKQDSVKASPVIPEEPIVNHKEVEWGLQWAFQLPTGSAGQYFTGPAATSQPYRVLLPGVWLNFRIGRSLFETEINPFASTVLPAKSFGTFTNATRNVDTIITTTEVKTLHKMFGMSATIGYAYNIAGNWWLGTSIQGYWWRKGIATTQGEETRQTIGSANQTKRSFSDNYSMTADERNYFTKFQVVNSLELGYKLRSSQAMLRVGITPLPFSKNQGPVNPFRAEFLYKLSLFGKKKTGSGFTP